MNRHKCFRIGSIRKNRICRGCGRKIVAGSPAWCESWVVERWYPVKGLMAFSKRAWYHMDCWPARHAEITESNNVKGTHDGTRNVAR